MLRQIRYKIQSGNRSQQGAKHSTYIIYQFICACQCISTAVQNKARIAAIRAACLYETFLWNNVAITLVGGTRLAATFVVSTAIMIKYMKDHSNDRIFKFADQNRRLPIASWNASAAPAVPQIPTNEMNAVMIGAPLSCPLQTVLSVSYGSS